jgi:hypothetical protein
VSNDSRAGFSWHASTILQSCAAAVAAVSIQLLASLCQQHVQLTAAGAVLGQLLVPVSATLLLGPLQSSTACAVLGVVRGWTLCCQQVAVGWVMLLVCCLLLSSWPCPPQLPLLLQMGENWQQSLAAQHQPPLGPGRVA